MKCSYSSYVNKKTFLFFPYFLLFFFRRLFQIVDHNFFSCREYCCLFEFPSLAVILKHSFRFINSTLYPMANPLHPFMSALMILVLKKDSLHIPNTFSLSLHHVLSFKHYPSTPINHSMTPAKIRGSSRYKGKGIASDDPAMLKIGNETTYSALDRFDEEEARRDPNSECAPLIDPQYDTHAHFPKVPSKYTPPSLSCVWLALCRRNTNVS